MSKKFRRKMLERAKEVQRQLFTTILQLRRVTEKAVTLGYLMDHVTCDTLSNIRKSILRLSGLGGKNGGTVLD